MRHPSEHELSSAEQAHLDLIVRSARKSGWILASDEVNARIDGPTVLVRNTQGELTREIVYAHSERWLLELLADLAHGRWRW